MKKILGIGDFFYVADRSYDYLAERALPCYHEAHKELVRSLCFEADQEAEVIDLGVGSGVTSGYILKNYPKVRMVAVDLFDEMLKEARVRLKPFGNRITLVQADNTEFLKGFGRQVSAIVSAFCIHHLDEQGKKELFRLIYDHLLPGGRFVMLDLSTFEDPCLKDVARKRTVEHMMAHVEDKQYRTKWLYHWDQINIPHPADRMVEWLKEAGFKSETVFRNYEVVVVEGTRWNTERFSIT